MKAVKSFASQIDKGEGKSVDTKNLTVNERDDDMMMPNTFFNVIEIANGAEVEKKNIWACDNF